MSFPTDNTMKKIRELEETINKMRDNMIFSPSTNDLSAVFGNLGSRNAAHGVQTGLQTDQPIDHLLTDVDDGGTSTGVFDRINLMSANVVIDKSGSTSLNLKTIQKTANNGQKITALTVKSGKSLTLKTGGNLAITTDIAMTDQDIAYLVYSENIGNKYRVLVSTGGGSTPVDAANRTLSNLIDPTSLNADLHMNDNGVIFDADGALGSSYEITRLTGALAFGVPTANTFDYYINGIKEYSYGAVNADLLGNNIIGIGPNIVGNVTTNFFVQDSAGWIYNAGTGDSHTWTINSIGELQLTTTLLNILNGGELGWNADGALTGGQRIARLAGGMALGVATGKTFTFYVNAIPEYILSSTSANFQSNTLDGIGITMTGDVTSNFLLQDASGWIYNVGTGDSHTWTINSIGELQLTTTLLNVLNGGEIGWNADGSLTAGQRIARLSGGMALGVALTKNFTFYVNGTPEYILNATSANFQSNTLDGIGVTMTGNVTTNFLLQDASGWIYNVGTGDSHTWTINSVGELQLTTTLLNILNGGELGWNTDGSLTAGQRIARLAGGMALGVALGKNFTFYVNGSPEYVFSSTNANLEGNTISDVGITITGNVTTNILQQDASGWLYQVGLGDSHTWTINGVGELQLTTTLLNILNGGELSWNADGSLTAGQHIARLASGMAIGVATGKTIALYVNGIPEYTFSSTNANFQGNTISGVGTTITGSVTTNILQQDSAGWLYQVGTGDSHIFTVNGIGQLEIGSGTINVLNGNVINLAADGGFGAGIQIARDAGALILAVPTGSLIKFYMDGILEYSFNQTLADFKNNNLTVGTGSITCDKIINNSDSGTYIDFVGANVIEQNIITGGTHKWLINNIPHMLLDATTLQLDANIELLNDRNLILGTTSGTKIGTSTTQKLGFWNKTPVVQPAAYTVTNPTTDRALNVTGDTLAQVAQVLGTLIADLQSMGLIG